jgi:hypothetical protein
MPFQSNFPVFDIYVLGFHYLADKNSSYLNYHLILTISGPATEFYWDLTPLLLTQNFIVLSGRMAVDNNWEIIQNAVVVA